MPRIATRETATAGDPGVLPDAESRAPGRGAGEGSVASDRSAQRPRPVCHVSQRPERHLLVILGYCLMPNHVHLVVVPEREASLQTALRNAHGRYATYLNARQATSGHVWQGRSYSCPLGEDHLWAALRYTERNPVRAGMVGDAVDYPWSSARVHVGGGWDSLVDVGLWSERWTLTEWREFLAATEFERESDAIRHSTHSGRPLGSANFVKRLRSEEHTSELQSLRH